MESFFLTSCQEALATSRETHKPVFVYVDDESNSLHKFFSPELAQTNALAATTFVGLRVPHDLEEHEAVQRVHRQTKNPGFYFVRDSKVVEAVTARTSVSHYQRIIGRMSRDKPLASPNTQDKGQRSVRRPADGSDSCTLVVRLLDGTSLRRTFSHYDTLNDVRSWLDDATGHAIIPRSSMPLFAYSPQPTNYMFHRPGAPHVTFSDTHEFRSLRDLGLCPRTVLVLKPVYDETALAYPGVWKSAAHTLALLTLALHSFFDYSVDAYEEQASPSPPPDVTMALPLPQSVTEVLSLDKHQEPELGAPSRAPSPGPSVVSASRPDHE